jgi:hypothetical protein
MGQHQPVFVPFMFWLNEPPLMVNAASNNVGAAGRFRNSSTPAAPLSTAGGGSALE